MGGAYSGEEQTSFAMDFSQQELQLLLNSTAYSPDEIFQLRAQFLADVPSGAVSRSVFRTAATTFGIRDTHLADMLFRAFDANNDGMITFFEFARAMSVMTRGSNTEKILFAFDMYDVHREGVLRYDTVLQVLVGVEDCFGKFRTYDARPELLTAQDVANRMFSRSHSVTKEMFREFAVLNPSIVKGLALNTT